MKFNVGAALQGKGKGGNTKSLHTAVNHSFCLYNVWLSEIKSNNYLPVWGFG